MKGELFFSFWERLHLPAAKKKSAERRCAKTLLTWLDWNWIKLIKSHQRSGKLFWTVCATAAKSCLVPSQLLLVANPLSAAALFAELVEEWRWSAALLLGEGSRSTGNTGGNSTGPEQGSAIFSAQRLIILTASVTGSRLLTKPSVHISLPASVHFPGSFSVYWALTCSASHLFCSPANK